METVIIKKRLNTFKSGKGTLTNVGNDVVMEVLRGWESWPGTSADYYREIGLSKMQLTAMIKKGKNLVRSGKVAESEFKEISLPTSGVSEGSLGGAAIELKLDAIRAIRFSQVDQLVDFIKKTT